MTHRPRWFPQLKGYLGIAVSVLCFFLALRSVHAERRLVTAEEMNGTQLYRAIQGRTFKIEKRIRPEYLIQGDSPVEYSSGVLYKNGYIITTYDAIKYYADISIYGSDLKSYKSRVVVFDKSRNIAILKIASGGPKFKTPLAIAKQSYHGEVVYSLGGLNGIHSAFFKAILGGKVSGKALYHEEGIGVSIRTYMMTNLQTTDGGSGTPVFNTRGQLLGLVDLNSLPEKSLTGVFTFVLPVDDEIRSLMDAIQ